MFDRDIVKEYLRREKRAKRKHQNFDHEATLAEIAAMATCTVSDVQYLVVMHLNPDLE